MKTLYSFTVVILFFSINVYALKDNFRPERSIGNSNTSVLPNIVKWTGTISDSPDNHTNKHTHDLIFTKNDSKEQYEIIDSPDLVKIHHNNEKNYLIEIEAEKTTRFLFWGGNLIVKNFKIINETESVPHLHEADKSSDIKFRRVIER